MLALAGAFLFGGIGASQAAALSTAHPLAGVVSNDTIIIDGRTETLVGAGVKSVTLAVVRNQKVKQITFDDGRKLSFSLGATIRSEQGLIGSAAIGYAQTHRNPAVAPRPQVTGCHPYGQESLYFGGPDGISFTDILTSPQNDMPGYSKYVLTYAYPPALGSSGQETIYIVQYNNSNVAEWTHTATQGVTNGEATFYLYPKYEMSTQSQLNENAYPSSELNNNNDLAAGTSIICRDVQ